MARVTLKELQKKFNKRLKGYKYRPKAIKKRLGLMLGSLV